MEQEHLQWECQEMPFKDQLHTQVLQVSRALLLGKIWSGQQEEHQLL